MTGILAINAFLHSEKYTQQDKHYPCRRAKAGD